MLKPIAVFLVGAALSAGCAATGNGRDAARIDGTSTEAAEASYSKMMAGLTAHEQERLARAVLVINMEGVKSAYGLAGNPELQTPSIARIKDKVAGMSASEIISLAARTTSVRIEPAGE